VAQLDGDLRYSFPSTIGDSGPVALDTLQDVAQYSARTSFASITINLPLDLTTPGSIAFTHNVTSVTTPDGDDSPMVWLDTNVLAAGISLDHIGIRKGGMITMPTWSTSLSLDTPYISLPTNIFNVLMQAARASLEQDLTVDCGLIPILPDLVFGLYIEDGRTLEGDEIVVTPEQYVMTTEAGTCVLLARSHGGLQKLGWAAIRGREFVVDLIGRRMGFEN
jgi:hypothetical protein